MYVVDGECQRELHVVMSKLGVCVSLPDKINLLNLAPLGM